ncbi:MAG: hypothetical protein KDE26_12925 [Bacteroidetes bacterium]|nr:hypothetical protein [Bacteroidota bacterium]
MVLFAIALMFLTTVILIVSLTYILSAQRNKEILALLEKGLDPKDYMTKTVYINTKKTGMFLIGIGLGFLVATLVDEYILTSIDNPGIYPAFIFPCAGMGLILYHKFFKKKNNEK